MNNQIKVSVVIPTYGPPVFLKNAIESVINQSFQDWELIIVDDNNSNTEARKKTEGLVAAYVEHDDRIKYVKHEKNKNGAAARNTGFSIARGEYISLLDSDDEYMPSRLRRCYDEMERASENYAGVYTGCEFRKKGKVFHRESNIRSGNFLVETLACRFEFCTGSNIFVRKSVIDELHGFDERFLRHQDYEFLVRLFERYSLIGISDILVIKNNENVNLPNIEKMITIKDQYMEKYKGRIESLPLQDQKYILFWKNITIAEGAMAQNKYRLANHYYKEAQRYGILSLKTWFRRVVFPVFNLLVN